MIYKNIFKALGVLSLMTLSLAEKSNNVCDEIENYLDSIENVYHQGDYINICRLNDKGEVIEAFFDSYDDDLIEENLLPILEKYNTFEKLLIRNFELSKKSFDLIKAYPNLTELRIERKPLDSSVKFDSGFKKLTSLALTLYESENINIPETIYSLKKLENLELKYYHLTQKDIDGISTLVNLKELEINQYEYPQISSEKFDFSSLKKLTNLTSLKLYKFTKDYPEFINFFPQLKELSLITINELESIPDNMLKLENLEILNLSDNKIYSLPNNIKKLKNLINLNLDSNEFSKIPDELKYLTNLKELYLMRNKITKFSDILKSLEKLEVLELSYNDIDDELPEFLNDLSHLKKIYLGRNKNIKGRTLTNKSLEVCEYEEHNYDLCLDPESVCLNVMYDRCKDDDNKISTDDTCGKGKGKCPDGKCCSKYGYCGTSDKHCYSGCQSEFGKCKQATTTTTTTTKTKTTKTSSKPTSTDGKCGKENGNTQCPDGKCCSKYGYCGTSDKHCYSGCQSEFGKCKIEEKISTNGKCGSTYGKCPNGKCCSKYGWCGSTSDYCGSGCQSQFGKCN